MDAIKLLEEDHKKVKKIMEDIDSTTERGVKTREELFAKVKRELTAHESIEEEIFYPAIQNEVEEMVAEAIEEHNIVDRLLLEIRDISPEDEQFDAKMTVLIENVEHHAEEEEKEMFPAVKKAMGADMMKTLGERMAHRKTELTREHRAA